MSIENQRGKLIATGVFLGASTVAAILIDQYVVPFASIADTISNLSSPGSELTWTGVSVLGVLIAMALLALLYKSYKLSTKTPLAIPGENTTLEPEPAKKSVSKPLVSEHQLPLFNQISAALFPFPDVLTAVVVDYAFTNREQFKPLLARFETLIQKLSDANNRSLLYFSSQLNYACALLKAFANEQPLPFEQNRLFSSEQLLFTVPNSEGWLEEQHIEHLFFVQNDWRIGPRMKQRFGPEIQGTLISHIKKTSCHKDNIQPVTEWLRELGSALGMEPGEVEEHLDKSSAPRMFT